MSDPWEELVSVALMGTERRDLDVEVLPPGVREPASRVEATAPERLLAAASLVHVAERAGALGPQTEPLVPAPVDSTADVSAAAAATLARLLQGGDRALLAEWLGAAASTGHHVPYRLLPPLLDLARSHAEVLRRPVAGALGERGRWLAGLRPDWEQVLAAARRDAEVPDPWGSRESWTHGDLAGRTAWFRAARAAEPVLAREELRSSWGTEAPAERAAFLAELRIGLALGDEELLEQALGDPRAEVRRTAADLLSSLAGSAYSQRMLERATSWVRIERSLLRSRLVVEPVDERDASLKRDQVPEPPKGSGGRRAWFLTQVLSRVPLQGFSAALGAEAHRIVELAYGSDWAVPLLQGLAEAARTSGNVDWCRALVALDPSAYLGLVGRLPSAEQARVIRMPAAQADPGAFVRHVLDLPRPWCTELAVAVVETTAGLRGLHGSTSGLLLDAAAHAAPADDPRPVLDALRAYIGPFDPSSVQWSAGSAALDVLTTRYRMREELT